MDRTEMIRLLGEAKDNNEDSLNELLIEIRDNIMNRRISRFLSKNRQVENEDIRQEFMIGVALGIHKADMNIGDPIEYLISQGIYRVRTFMKSQIIKGTTQTCMKCGYVSRLNIIDGKYTCKKCGSDDVTTQEMNDLDDGTKLNSSVETVEDFEAELIFNDLMDKFEKTLTEGTNVYQLYILIKSGINRNNPEVKNYIKEIAEIWNCSQNNVMQAMKKLQNKLMKFAEDNDMSIEGNRFVDRR